MYWSAILCLVATSLMTSASQPPSLAYILHTIDLEPATVLASIHASTGSISSKSSLRGGVAEEPIVGQDHPKFNLESVLEQHITPIGRSLANGPIRREYYGLVTVTSSKDVELLRNSPSVVSVTLNEQIHATEFTDSWNLDRIDQAFGLDGEYTPPPEKGRNVDIYIVDSGVWGSHTEFVDLSSTAIPKPSRVLPGFSVDENAVGNDDCNGHGTHVASTAAGNTVGVARQATIIPVRVLDCAARSSLWMILQGISWLTSSIGQRKGSLGRRAVVNLSLTTSDGTSEPLDRAVAELVKLGAVFVTAAGNNNFDACRISPGRDPSVINVGSLARDESKLGSSNFGPCVTLYAPGDRIIGAFPMQNQYITRSGTSMAAPLVAGVVATMLERTPQLTPVQVKTQLLQIGMPITPAFDEDCVGVLTPAAKLLQGLTGALASVAAAGTQASPAFGLSEARVGSESGDFTWWSPRAVIPAVSLRTKTAFCFTFNARFTSAAPSGRMSIIISSREYPSGMTALDRRPPSALTPCNNTRAGWVMMDASTKGWLILRSGNEINSRGTVASGGAKALSLPLSADRDLKVSVQLSLLSASEAVVKVSYFNTKTNAKEVVFDQLIQVPALFLEQPLKLSFKASDMGSSDLAIRDLNQCTPEPSTFTAIPTVAPSKSPTARPTKKPTRKPTARKRARAKKGHRI